MTPYSIRCGSCNAKLKVTKPELVGQRVRCPKCDAKVLVLPLEQEAQAHADTLDAAPAGPGDEAEVAGFSDFGDVTALLEAEQKNKRRKREAEKGDSEAQEKAAAGSPATTTVDPQWLDPAAAWTSAETSARQRWILWATIAALVAVVGLGAIALLINELRKSDTVADVQPPPVEVGENATKTDPFPDTEPEPAADDSSKQDSNPAEPSDEKSEEEASAGEPPTMPPVVDETVDTSDSTVPPATEAGTETEPSTLSPFESLIGGINETDTAIPAEGTSEARPFVGLLEDLSALGSIMTTSPFERARSLADQELRTAYRFRIDPNEVFVEPPKPRSVRFDDQYAIPLAAIDLGEISLLDFLEFASKVSGLSITVEPDAIEATGVDLSALLTVRGEATDIGTLLTETLAPLKLAPRRMGDSIEITLAAETPLTSESYKVEGLGSFVRDRMPLLIEVIRAMVAPEAWDGVEGAIIESNASDLKVTQAPIVQWRLSQFLQRWKETIAPVEGESASKILGPQARRDAARELLQRRISLEHLQPIRLTALADELGNAAGCRVLIDWRALENAGWNLDTEVPCNVLDEPLWSALDSTLRPAGLAARVLDATTLQITTANDLLGRPEIEFHSVRGLLETGVTPQELAERLPIVFKAVGTQDPERRFFFDPETALLITALPAPQQQALTRFLTEWERFAREAPAP